MKRVSLVLFLLASLLSTFSTPANAVINVTATNDPNGLCGQTVSITTGVVANKLGRDCIVQFTSTAATTSWTAPLSVSYKYLAVGGGGSGTRGICGVYYGQGGGGGDVESGTASINSGNSISIKVGAGGLRTGNCPAAGNSGETTTVNGINAPGGQAGNNTQTNNAGATGGKSGSGKSGGTGAANGVSCTGNGCEVGGGGGAGTSGSGRDGGFGLFSNITGTNLEYGAGGGGLGYTTGYLIGNAGVDSSTSGAGVAILGRADAADNRGGGGCDGAFDGTWGSRGGSGLVVLRYTLPDLTTSFSNSNSKKFITSNLSATVQIPGRVTFYWNGRPINRCMNLAVTSSVTCPWKPLVQGQQTITAVYTPTDTSFPTQSLGSKIIAVSKR